MSNIQVRGADGLTIYFLWAEGEGTNDNPFKSKYLVEQSGEWAVAVNNLPAVYPVTFEWQGITEAQLRSAPVAVTGDFYQPVQPVSIVEGLISLPVGSATEDTLAAIYGRLPNGLVVTPDGLKVDANVVLPTIYSVTGSVEVTNFPATIECLQSGNWIVALDSISLTKLDSINDSINALSNTVFDVRQSGDWSVAVNNFPATQVVTGTVTADIGLNQPLTNTELRASPLEVDIDVSLLATEQTLSSLSSKVPQLALTGDRLKVDADITPQTEIAVNNYAELIAALQAATLQANIKNNVSVIGDLFDKTGLATDTNQTITNSLIGQVQDTPTANTLLDRLKTIATLLSGTIRNSPVVASTPTLTNVASSATSVTLLSANANRKTVIIVNDSNATLYVKFDASAASATSYSLKLSPAVNDIPAFTTFSGSDYSGEVRGIWSSANGFARITEVV